MSSLLGQKLIPISEAARFLEVSIDTVRRWDHSGKLHSTRLNGKDRYFSLSELEQVRQTGAAGISNSPPSAETITPQISIGEGEDFDQACLMPNHNDAQIYHVFEGVALIGIGLIFIITQGEDFGLSGWANDWFYFMAALVIMFIGLARIITSYYQEYFARYAIITKFLLLIVEGGYMLTALMRGYLAFLPFITALFTVNFIRLMMKIIGSRRGTTCFIRFSFFLLVLTIMSGLVITFEPATFPFMERNIINFISGNQFIFTAGWFLACIPLLLFSMSPFGRNSKIMPTIFSFGGLLAILIATQMAIDSRLSLAYLNYLTGEFVLFTAWWASVRVKIPIAKSSILLIALVWIAGVTLAGLFSFKVIQDKTKQKKAELMMTELAIARSSIKNMFDSNAALMRSTIQKYPVNDIAASKDTESAVQTARQVYDQGVNLRGVNFVDQQGIAVGSYPRNPLIIGTNFSSRNYFIQTQASFAGVVGEFFINILGNPNLIQTEPFFENNNISGMLTASVDLEKISVALSRQVGDNSSLTILDANKVVIIDTQNPASIGNQAEIIFFNQFGPHISPNKITVHNRMDKPPWELFLTTQTDHILADLLPLGVFLSILLMVNGFISLVATVSIVKKQHGSR